MGAFSAAVPNCLPPLSFSLTLSRCNNENEWYQIHENIIRKSNTKYSAPSTNYGKYAAPIDLLPVSVGLDVLLISPLVWIWRGKKKKWKEEKHLLLKFSLSKAAHSKLLGLKVLKVPY